MFMKPECQFWIKQTSKQLKLIDAMSKHEMGILIIAIIRHCNTVRTIDRVRRLNISSENVPMNGNVERKSIWISLLKIATK